MNLLDALGTIALAVPISVIFTAVLGEAAIARSYRLALGALAGAWVGLSLAVTAAGALNRLPVLLAMFALPLIVAAVAATSSRVRAAYASVPSDLAIGLNVLRVLGFFFLLLASAGRLGGPFPYWAGIGDIITGAFAIPIARVALRNGVGDPRVVLWNAFGMLDLIGAVALGVMSGNGSALQLIHAGAGSAAISTLPWSMVPLVLVPLFLIGHVTLFARMRAQSADLSPEYRPSLTS
jgi:hypothetical protein